MNIGLCSFRIVFAASSGKRAALGAVDIVRGFYALAGILQSHKHEIGRMHTAVECSPNPIQWR